MIMARLISLLAPHILLLLYFAVAISGADHYSRADFPLDFVFGSGISAPQYEGAASEDGRTPSIWDTFAPSGQDSEGATEDITCDGYHKYKGDVRLMVETGLEALRFSISWSRLIPNGRGPINKKGLQYYNNLINELISNGIQPHVTLQHLDLPQALQDEYGGWTSREIVKDFVEYADACFKEFGDRVLHWTTLNEVNIASIGGYDDGIAPPGRCSTRSRCAAGDSSTEPYKALHNMLLAHSAAAKLYREKYKGTQNGKIGLNIYSFGFLPNSNSIEDVMATERAYSFYLDWAIHPLVFGDYPAIVKERAQTRIPAFTKRESEQVKGSLDFIGLNHYTTLYIQDDPNMSKDVEDFNSDIRAQQIYDNKGAPELQYPLMPWGLKQVLEYLKDGYGNPPIYIQENGQRTKRDGILNDTSRVDYMQTYIGGVLDAVRNGSNIKGYFEWAFLDCNELLVPYGSSFGLFYVDLDDELKRYRKLSALWYSDFLKEKSISEYAITQVGENMI
ncbi:hypothetical protein ACS0TY_007820 [Phlomoides rotata]